MAQPYDFPYEDHRHGQPRSYQGRTLYLNDHPQETLDEALASHSKLWLVVYDHKNRPAYTSKLKERFNVTPTLIGRDLLFELKAPQNADH